MRKHNFVLAVLLISISVLAGLNLPDLQPTWNYLFFFSGYDNVQPSISQDASGTYWIAWASNRGAKNGGVQNVWLTFSRDGYSWNEPSLVSELGGVYVTESSITVNVSVNVNPLVLYTNDGILIVWSSLYPNWTIFHVKCDADRNYTKPSILNLSVAAFYPTSIIQGSNGNIYIAGLKLDEAEAARYSDVSVSFMLPEILPSLKGKISIVRSSDGVYWETVRPEIWQNNSNYTSPSLIQRKDGGYYLFSGNKSFESEDGQQWALFDFRLEGITPFSMSALQDKDGIYRVISSGEQGKVQIYYGVDGNWNIPANISISDSSTHSILYPQIFQDMSGRFLTVWVSYKAGSEARIWIANSSDGIHWNNPYQFQFNSREIRSIISDFDSRLHTIKGDLSGVLLLIVLAAGTLYCYLYNKPDEAESETKKLIREDNRKFGYIFLGANLAIFALIIAWEKYVLYNDFLKIYSFAQPEISIWTYANIFLDSISYPLVFSVILVCLCLLIPKLSEVRVEGIGYIQKLSKLFLWIAAITFLAVLAFLVKNFVNVLVFIDVMSSNGIYIINNALPTTIILMYEFFANSTVGTVASFFLLFFSWFCCTTIRYPTLFSRESERNIIYSIERCEIEKGTKVYRNSFLASLRKEKNAKIAFVALIVYSIIIFELITIFIPDTPQDPFITIKKSLLFISALIPPAFIVFTAAMAKSWLSEKGEGNWDIRMKQHSIQLTLMGIIFCFISLIIISYPITVIGLGWGNRGFILPLVPIDAFLVWFGITIVLIFFSAIVVPYLILRNVNFNVITILTVLVILSAEHITSHILQFTLPQSILLITTIGVVVFFKVFEKPLYEFFMKIDPYVKVLNEYRIPYSIQDHITEHIREAETNRALGNTDLASKEINNALKHLKDETGSAKEYEDAMRKIMEVYGRRIRLE